jgi:hypothetical protein
MAAIPVSLSLEVMFMNSKLHNKNICRKSGSHLELEIA